MFVVLSTASGPLAFLVWLKAKTIRSATLKSYFGHINETVYDGVTLVRDVGH